MIRSRLKVYEVPGFRHRCRVYKFGALWFWKCRNPFCEWGGRYREWGSAFKAANSHARTAGKSPGCRR